MNRRSLLRTLGIGSVGLAGCAALGDETAETTTPTETQTAEPTPTESSEPTPEPTPTAQMEDTPTAKYHAPPGGEPHVWNPPKTYRTKEIGNYENVDNPEDNRGNSVFLFRRQPVEAVFEVQVADLAATAIRLHDVFQIPAKRSLHLVLEMPSDYAINIYDFVQETGWTLDIARSAFNCNGGTHVAYGIEGDDFRWSNWSTRKDCDA